MSRYLERYLQGEYQGVYDEILALGEAPLEPSVHADVQAVMNEIMNRVRYNLEHILLPNLHEIGYRFGDGMLDNPDNLSATQRAGILAKYPLFLPPDPKAPQLLQSLEQIVERPVPLSLKCWYQHIGAVNLIGAFPPALMREGAQALPQRYKRGYTLDPLYIEQVKQVLKEVQFEFTPAEYEYGWVLPLSWDGELKYGYSGSGSYGLSLTSNVVDAVFQGGKYTVPFVEYIRFCLKQAGFPGLGEYITIREETLQFLTKDLLPF
jgi:hypothetical protein